mmetsp:Transcript_41181/g.105291  ORF Transcript_41181/g.105291 Transcript_41181/m.105291 type:complete len:266 (-) Transcript_41181:66-863(-)
MPLLGPRGRDGGARGRSSSAPKLGPTSMLSMALWGGPIPGPPPMPLLLMPLLMELAKLLSWLLPSIALRSILVFSISIAFFFMTSLVSLILLWMIILCSFSSWLSMSVFCFTCVAVMFSLKPLLMTSSKAKSSSNAAREIASSSSGSTYIGTTLDSSRSVSRSSRMLLCLFVTSSRYSPSSGWYTYRTALVSTKVCCCPVPTSLGNAASRPSMRMRLMSTNWRDTSGLPVFVTREAARTTMVTDAAAAGWLGGERMDSAPAGLPG